jgi:16S rRNA (guanine527-N7)-methyltransferase
MADFLRENLKKIGCEPNDLQCEQLNNFHKILCEWNEFMNLTGITEYNEVVIKHFVDSLAVNCVYSFKKTDRVVDIGTGAGFPGIPLKIMYPDTRFTLLDSLNKRIKFLDEVIRINLLDGIETLHGRAEDYARDKNYREAFDVCVSRAVANLSTLSEYCLPYVKVGGVFISYKAGQLDEELKASERAIKLLGGEIKEVHKLTLPDTDIDRTFVVIKKTVATSRKYPRKAGLPSKEPL